MKRNTKKYPDPQLDDIVTYYFVTNIKERPVRVVAWSSDKEMIDFYLRFHKCENLCVKKIKARYEKIIPMLNDAGNDEVEIANIRTLVKGELDYILVPMTTTELSVLHQVIANDCVDIVPFIDITHQTKYLRKKYRNALDYLYLYEIARSIASGNESILKASIGIDELKLLTKIFPSNFGI